MPSNIDKAFIENLQNFTDSLGDLVKLLTEQSKQGGDTVNKAMAAMDSEKIGVIVEDMKTLLKSNRHNFF